MEQLKHILLSGQHSLVIENGQTYTFDARGVADLRRLLATRPELLRGARVADKAIGKGAAALLVLGRVAEVWTPLASTPALALLREHGIRAVADTEVPRIENARRTGLCPIEQACMPCASAEECLASIDAFFARINRKQE